MRRMTDLEKRPPAPCGLHHVGRGRLWLLIVLWLRHVEEKRAEKGRKKKDKEERTRREGRAVGTWRLLVTNHLSHTPVPVWRP